MNKSSRKQTRLKHYDYSKAGYYFVTVCTQNMNQLFGKIIDGKMVFSNAGLMVDDVLNQTPNEFNNIELNKYIIMPNHVHAIIIINSRFVGANLVFARKDSSNRERAKTSFAPTLGNFVKVFKSKTTVEYIKGVKSRRFPPFNRRIWQRNYHDHIIRNQQDYQKIWHYIDTNPQKWELDKYYQNIT